MKLIRPLLQIGRRAVKVCEVPEMEFIEFYNENVIVLCLRVAAYIVVDTETAEKWPLCQAHGDMAKERGWVE